jgi:hypothetical protein
MKPIAFEGLLKRWIVEGTKGKVRGFKQKANLCSDCYEMSTSMKLDVLVKEKSTK